MSRALSEFTTLSFDCYGTLIDWETGIWDALQPLLMEGGGEELARGDALRLFAEEELAIESRYPSMIYSEVLARVHNALARRTGLPTRDELDEAFGASLAHWPAFSDTAEALRRLKRRYRLVILSNVHREGFAASNRKLGVHFDAIYTAQDIGSFKPSPGNFEFLLERLQVDHGVEPAEILHTAQSLYHDHLPARSFGLATAWIDRNGQFSGGDSGATAPVEPIPELDFCFPTLAALADAAEATSAG